MKLYLYTHRRSLQFSRVFIVISIENVEDNREIVSRKKQLCKEHLSMLEYPSCLFGQNVLKCR
jgi:hypothetical protein